MSNAQGYTRVVPALIPKLIHSARGWSFLDFRVLLLCLAVAVYAMFGEPTPSDFGWAEGLVGLCLVTAIGWPRFPLLWSLLMGRMGLILLVYGVVAGLAMFAFLGHMPMAMMRDGVGFGFLILPLLLWPLFAARPEAAPALVLCVSGLGVVLSLRALGVLGEADPLSYLANMPSVLFAAIASMGAAIHVFVTRFSVQAVLISAGLMAVSVIAVMAMAAAQQRASLGLYALVALMVLAVQVVQRPKRVFVLLVLACIALWPFMGELAQMAGALVEKTRAVGANMRGEEWRAVWTAVRESPLYLMFGKGWGASFSSPAVADIEVFYTHSLLSSMLLKSGLVGMSLAIAFIGGLLVMLIRSAVPLWLALAIGAPIMIDVLFYASYKSLDFGLVLALIPALSSYARYLEDQKSQNIEVAEVLR